MPDALEACLVRFSHLMNHLALLGTLDAKLLGGFVSLFALCGVNRWIWWVSALLKGSEILDRKKRGSRPLGDCKHGGQIC